MPPHMVCNTCGGIGNKAFLAISACPELLAILAEGAIALSVTHSLLLRTRRIALHPCICITWSMKSCTQHKRHAEIKLLVLI